MKVLCNTNCRYVNISENARLKNFKMLLEKGNTCGIICVEYNCNALQFGLGESSLDHRRREEFPAIFTMVVSFGGVNERT